MSTIFDNAVTGFRLVDTRRGDTLPIIAAREMGDASQWPLLISYNNLISPFITDDPTQVTTGLILTGQQIIVPAPTPLVSAVIDPDEVFQIDVALDDNGLLYADDSGDFATVSGTDNLEQALEARIDTDQGDLIYHPDYGSRLRLLLGAVESPGNELLAGAYAKAAVTPDPRVQSIQSATVTVAGVQTQVALVVVPIVGRPVPLAMTLS